MAYIFAAIVWVYLHSLFCGGLQKTHLYWSRMRIGRSRSSKVVDFGTNQKGVCDFLLVINSNFGPILHRFWDMASYWLKIANFSYPTLVCVVTAYLQEFISSWNRVQVRTIYKVQRWSDGWALYYTGRYTCFIIRSAYINPDTSLVDGLI